MSRPHTHRELELNLVCSGQARYWVDGYCYALAPRSLVWLFPEQEHILIDCTADFSLWIAVFRPRLVAQTVSQGTGASLRLGNPGTDWHRRLTVPAAGRMNRLFEDLAAAASRGPGVSTFNAGLRYLLLEAHDQYRQASTPETGGEVHPAVAKTIRILRDHTEPLSETQLARLTGLSRAHLSRLFLRQTGVSLVDFRNRLRTERFLALYGSGQHITMLTAALQAGFGSYAQFFRSFRRITGISPSTYRRRQT